MKTLYLKKKQLIEQWLMEELHIENWNQDVSRFAYVIQIPITVINQRMIDIEHNERVKISKAYLQWAKVHNLKARADKFAFWDENRLINNSKDEEKYQKVTEHLTAGYCELKLLDEQIRAINSEISLLGQYFSLRQKWKEYCKCGKDSSFHEKHKETIDSYPQVLAEIKERYQ